MLDCYDVLVQPQTRPHSSLTFVWRYTPFVAYTPKPHGHNLCATISLLVLSYCPYVFCVNCSYLWATGHVSYCSDHVYRCDKQGGERSSQFYRPLTRCARYANYVYISWFSRPLTRCASLTQRPGGNHRFPGGGPPDGGPPGGRPPGGPFGGHHHNNPQNPRQQQDNGFKFEKKIKISEVPEWDGDTDKILEWLDDLNHLSFRSPRVHEELGMIAPLRLKGPAKAWFYALKPITQRTIQRSWADFKLALSTYFMNQQWFDKMKGRILRMRYRQKGHESETPSDYYHHKLRMIQEVFVQTETETIMEIMNGAPKYWSVLIDTSRINTLADLQYYIKYHEDSLMRNPDTVTYDLEKRIKALESRSSS